MAMPRTADHGFDFVFVDKENHAVVAGEAKTHPVERWETILSGLLARFAEPVAFVLAIDPDSIQFYKSEREGLGERIARLDTRQILEHYDPEFPGKRVFEPYLVTLVEAWLRDLAYHWKSESPPGSEELRRAGLLEKLEGGNTQRLGA
jgi:hypothetical protein